MDDDDEIDTAEIARMFGVTRPHATDVLTKKHGFPRPVKNLSQRLRRWRRGDIKTYMVGKKGRS